MGDVLENKPGIEIEYEENLREHRKELFHICPVCNPMKELRS